LLYNNNMTNTKTAATGMPHIISNISFHPDKRKDLFLALSKGERVEVILALTNHIKKEILTQIPEQDLLELLERVDPDDVTDLLQLLNPHKREKTLGQLNAELKETVARLLQFNPETAAGLMNLDYIQADINDNIATVSKKFKLHEKRTGRLPVILVTSKAALVGFLPGHQLGFAKVTEKIKKYVKHIPSIKDSSKHEEVLQLFRSNPHNKVAVVDDKRAIVGIIYSDDVLRLMHEQETASLYNFAGVSDEEGVMDSAKRKVKFRYRWLIINLGTGFLAAFTVGLFEATITKYVLLAVYMPIVAGMGGNAATQTLAVVVRGIALKQIDVSTALRTLKSELGAGFINGLINGFLVAFIVLVKDRDIKIAIVLALAMVINLIVAAVFGTLVPILMSKLKKDPASSATIFITTATDVLGFLAFLGLATLILS
jgi:magnesium transporter